MQATRERILNILKERGQVTVEELSRELGLTTVTVRHHLDILRGEGFISAPLTYRRKAPGRPKHVYTLTEQAGAFFPKKYGYLAHQILDEVRARLSPAEVDQMMQRIGERIAGQATLPIQGDLESRFIAAVEFLDGMGYMTQWERSGDGNYVLHIANCPYEWVSRQAPEICAMDMALLTRLLGASPQRVASAAHGDHQCTYIIRPSAA